MSEIVKLSPRPSSRSTWDFEMQRLLRPQPGGEGQHLVRREVHSDQRGIADDLGSRVVVPPHHHLRLGEHEVVEPVDRAVERRDRGGGARPLCVEAIMGAHQEHGAHHREEQHADEERERGDLVLVERFEGVEIGEPDGERIGLRGGFCGRPQQGSGDEGNPYGNGHRMPALARWHPDAARPDQPRHLPPHTPVPPHGGPRNCRRDALRLAGTNAPPKHTMTRKRTGRRGPTLSPAPAFAAGPQAERRITPI